MLEQELLEIILIVHHQPNVLEHLSQITMLIQHIGKCNHLEFVEEDRLEVVCDIKNVKTVLKALRDTHPYEEPVIDIIPLLDESLFI